MSSAEHKCHICLSHHTPALSQVLVMSDKRSPRAALEFPLQINFSSQTSPKPCHRLSPVVKVAGGGGGTSERRRGSGCNG